MNKQLIRQGLGDVIVYLSHEGLELQDVILAGPSAPFIAEILPCPCTILDAKKPYRSREDVEARFGKIDAEEITVDTHFPRLTRYSGWNALQNALQSLQATVTDKWIICPKSMNGPPQRWFNADEMACLPSNSVILYHEPVAAQRFPILTLPLMEALALIRGSLGFIGVDSALAIAACQVLPKEKILIKSINPKFYNFAKYYCAPHTEFNFIVDSINKGMLPK